MHYKYILLNIILILTANCMTIADDNTFPLSKYQTLIEKVAAISEEKVKNNDFFYDFYNLSDQEIELYSERCEKSLAKGEIPVFDEPNIVTMIDNIENHPFWKNIQEISHVHYFYLRRHNYPQVDPPHIVAFITSSFIEIFIFPKILRAAKEGRWDDFCKYFQTVALSVSPNSLVYYMLARKLNIILPLVLKNCAVPDATKTFIKDLCSNIVNDFIDINDVDVSMKGITEHGKTILVSEIEEFKKIISSV